jgi:hypothetical protein
VAPASLCRMNESVPCKVSRTCKNRSKISRKNCWTGWPSVRRRGKQTPGRSVQVTHTGDWQPGDEVSFSFSGTVYGPSGEKQTQDDYTGDVVGIVDSQGNKTEMPWSELTRYKVPEAATRVTAFLMAWQTKTDDG